MGTYVWIELLAAHYVIREKRGHLLYGKLSKLKSGETLDWVQLGGDRQKIKKIPSFSWEKLKIRGGKQKSPKFQRVSKTEK